MCDQEGHTTSDHTAGDVAINNHKEPKVRDNSTDVQADDVTHEHPTHTFTVLHHNESIEFSVWQDSTIQDLSDNIAENLSIPAANQKFLITPKVGLLKPPFKQPDLLLTDLQNKKVVLMGATTAEVESLTAKSTQHAARISSRTTALARPARATRWVDTKRVIDASKYTFARIEPLPQFRDAEKSRRFLTRLANDAGIKASMAKHHFTVGLLTEMDPAQHTTHESRTLGLNRNRGEVIELRLRTDAYDGYRDYKVIRKTLCHELAHNVWGDHDQNFWKLCKEIEAEVDKNDWRAGGKSVGGEEFYEPNDTGEDETADHGGWTGGSHVLGGSSTDTGLSVREIRARAAEERYTKQRAAEKAEKEAKSPP